MRNSPAAAIFRSLDVPVTVAACRYAQRGVRGLFHGFVVTSFSGITVNALSITSYLYLRDKLMDNHGMDIRSAGAASGALTELLVAPFAIPSQVVSQVLLTGDA